MTEDRAKTLPKLVPGPATRGKRKTPHRPREIPQIHPGKTPKSRGIGGSAAGTANAFYVGEGAAMKKAIAIGILGLVLAAPGATAQTAGEQARILGEFQRSVLDYTQNRTQNLDCSSEVAPVPAPRIFTLPVAMVFRQLIANALAERDGVAVVHGVGVLHDHAVLEPFPAQELVEFPRVLRDTLPVLPEPLEYRLIGADLVLRDTQSETVVGVLREAFGALTTVRR